MIAPLEEKFPGAFKFLSHSIETFKTSAETAMNNVRDIFAGITTFVSGVFSGDWSQAIDGITGIFSGMFNLMEANVSSAFNTITDLFETLIAPLEEKFPFVFDLLSGTLNAFKDTVGDVISNAREGVTNVFGGIVGTLGDLMKTPINAVIGMINSAIDGINSISLTIPDWVPNWAGGGKSFGVNIPKIPMLAEGTDYHIGGPAIVGEKGPEIVNLKKGDTVTPNDKTNRILADLNRRNRAQPPQRYDMNSSNQAATENGMKRTAGSLMSKVEVTIQRIIVGGELTTEKTEDLRKMVMKVFKGAWEQAWYELCIKYPNLTEV